MEAVLRLLMEISIYACILYGAILLIKKCLNDRLSPAMHYALWMLLIVRLVLPVTFESDVHLFVIPQEPSTAVQQQQPAKDVAAPVYRTPMRVGDQTMPIMHSGVMAPAYTAPVQIDEVQAERVPSHTWTMEEKLLALWLLGVCVSLVWSGSAYLGLRRRLKRDSAPVAQRLQVLLEACKEELGIRKRIAILCPYEVGSPALLWPNTLVMPLGALATMDEQAVRFALMHELMHVKRKDHVLNALLCVVRALYWFHPLVHLACTQIRADMESACDSAVVRQMDHQQRNAYAKLILSLFSRTMYTRPVLGMAISKTKRMAEQRIRGVYRCTRSKWSARCIAGLLTAVLVFTCFTTACQPTPDAPIVVNKNDGKLDEQISATPEVHDNALKEQLGAPETWRQSLSKYVPKGMLNIELMANVSVPQIDAAPVLTIKKQMPDEKTCRNIISYFFGEEPIYIADQTLIKDDIAAYILRDQQSIAAMEEDRERYGEAFAEIKEQYEREIQRWQEEYKKAPDTVALVPWDGNIVPDLQLMTVSEDQTRTFLSISDYQVSYYTKGDYVERNLYKDVQTDGGRDAIAIADQALEAMGLKDTVVFGGIAEPSGRVQKVNDIDTVSRGYMVRYYPSVLGMPVFPYTFNRGSDTAIQGAGADNLYAKRAPAQEGFSFTILDGTIQSFIWNSPSEVVSVENENVELLPFTKIQELFSEKIFQNYYVDENMEETLYITDVSLSLMRVNKPDSEDYYLLPVWDFMGYSKIDHQTDEEELEQHKSWWQDQSICTINAVDGSIINRYMGY